MFKVSFEKLLENAGGQYQLLTMAFQRTQQLNTGLLPAVKTKSKKNATIALEEIADFKVKFSEPNENESEEPTDDE